jgi:hypothetical protein
MKIDSDTYEIYLLLQKTSRKFNNISCENMYENENLSQNGSRKWTYFLVLQIRIGSDPNLFGWIRIRIQALINDPISTFWCVYRKSHKYFWNICCLTFWFIIPFKAYSGKKITEETWPNIYLVQDLHVYKSRIRSKIVRILTTGIFAFRENGKRVNVQPTT